MLKRVVLLHILVETIIHCFQDFFYWIETKKQHLFEMEFFYNIINVCIVTFDQFNTSLLNKSVNFFQKIFLLSLQVPEALHLPVSGWGGEGDGAAEAGSGQTHRPQTPGRWSHQAGPRERGLRKRQKARYNGFWVTSVKSAAWNHNWV